MASSLPTWLSNERARTALIGDIHGNFVALDAVLSDSERRGVDGVVCLGDLAAGGPQPREAIERLRDLGFAAVRGNTDEWLLGDVPGDPETDDDRRLQETVAWGRAQLTELQAL
jgi:predicted phosphodiesterase